MSPSNKQGHPLPRMMGMSNRWVVTMIGHDDQKIIFIHCVPQNANSFVCHLKPIGKTSGILRMSSKIRLLHVGTNKTRPR